MGLAELLLPRGPQLAQGVVDRVAQLPDRAGDQQLLVGSALDATEVRAQECQHLRHESARVGRVEALAGRVGDQGRSVALELAGPAPPFALFSAIRARLPARSRSRWVTARTH
jgi:hypothetical protein